MNLYLNLTWQEMHKFHARMLFNKLQLSLASSVSILTWPIDWHHSQVAGNSAIDLFLLFQHTFCEPKMMRCPTSCKFNLIVAQVARNVTRQNSVAGVRFPVFGKLPRVKVTADRR